jgi:hypothetical protein
MVDLSSQYWIARRTVFVCLLCCDCYYCALLLFCVMLLFIGRRCSMKKIDQIFHWERVILHL